MQVVRGKIDRLSGPLVSAAHRYHPRSLTEMGLPNLDNLVYVAHALFYVALVLALLWMFECHRGSSRLLTPKKGYGSIPPLNH